jgi:hypothetical protein
MTRERLERTKIRRDEIKTRFITGMQNQGLTPVENLGGGNCVFMSLAEIVFGDASHFDFMRYMIVHRLRSFPKKYQGNLINFSDYCNSMAISGKAASPREL